MATFGLSSRKQVLLQLKRWLVQYSSHEKPFLRSSWNRVEILTIAIVIIISVLMILLGEQAHLRENYHHHHHRRHHHHHRHCRCRCHHHHNFHRHLSPYDPFRGASPPLWSLTAASRVWRRTLEQGQRIFQYLFLRSNIWISVFEYWYLIFEYRYLNIDIQAACEGEH